MIQETETQSIDVPPRTAHEPQSSLVVSDKNTSQVLPVKARGNADASLALPVQPLGNADTFQASHADEDVSTQSAVKAHQTRRMSTLWAHFQGVPIKRNNGGSLLEESIYLYFVLFTGRSAKGRICGQKCPASISTISKFISK